MTPFLIAAQSLMLSFADSEEKLQNLLNNVNERGKELGMERR
jgi:hypothetical protein